MEKSEKGKIELVFQKKGKKKKGKIELTVLLFLLGFGRKKTI